MQVEAQDLRNGNIFEYKGTRLVVLASITDDRTTLSVIIAMRYDDHEKIVAVRSLRTKTFEVSGQAYGLSLVAWDVGREEITGEEMDRMDKIGRSR